MASPPAFAKESPPPPPMDEMRHADRSATALNPTACAAYACARQQRIFVCHCIDILHR